MTSLAHLKRKLVAGNGGNGMGDARHGRSGADVVVTVPPGTRVVEAREPCAADQVEINDEERIRKMYKLYPGWEDRGEVLAWEREVGLHSTRHRRRSTLASRHLNPLHPMTRPMEPFDLDTSETPAVLVARGGAGGRGNIHFTTRNIRDPRFCTYGQHGESRELILELRLLAEVGFVGAPNAGKSTLLGALTRARPKIADYAFTTLTPQLGMLASTEAISMADIPGLIQGAHQGRGLGMAFLRHVERSRVLVHVVDISLGANDLDETLVGDVDTEFDAVAKEFTTIRDELKAYRDGLCQRVKVVAANKIDALPEDVALRRLAALQQTVAVQSGDEVVVVPISAKSGSNLGALVEAVSLAVQRARATSKVVAHMQEEG